MYMHASGPRIFFWQGQRPQLYVDQPGHSRPLSSRHIFIARHSASPPRLTRPKDMRWQLWFERVMKTMPEEPGTNDYSCPLPQDKSATGDFSANAHLEVLGLNSSASPTEVKKRYKDLALKHHPDKGGAPGRFKEIHEAYLALVRNHPSGGFRYDYTAGTETNYIRAKEYGICLDRIRPQYQLADIEAFIPLLKTFMFEINLIDAAPDNLSLDLNRRQLVLNFWRVLNFVKTKQAVLSIHPPDRSLPIAERASQIRASIQELDKLPHRCSLFNDYGPWGTDGFIANRMVLDKYLSLYRSLIECSPQDEMKKINTLARKKVLFFSVKLREWTERMERYREQPIHNEWRINDQNVEEPLLQALIHPARHVLRQLESNITLQQRFFELGPHHPVRHGI